MSFITEFKKLYSQYKAGIIRTENVRIGEEWEADVRKVFFPADLYDIIERTHPFRENQKDFVKSSLNPDYKFLCKATQKEFFIECKARDITKFTKKLESIDDEFVSAGKDKAKLKALDEKYKYSEIFELCTEDQFIRFKDLNKTTKVLFMIVLFHEKVENFPEQYVLLPLDNLLTNRTYFGLIADFQVPNFYVSPANLWRHFLLFYGSEGHCIRCNSKAKYNTLQPFCYDCWQKWHKYRTFTFGEKYCHYCGESHETCSIKPLCNTCYKKFPVNYNL